CRPVQHRSTDAGGTGGRLPYPSAANLQAAGGQLFESACGDREGKEAGDRRPLSHLCPEPGRQGPVPARGRSSSSHESFRAGAGLFPALRSPVCEHRGQQMKRTIWIGGVMLAWLASAGSLKARTITLTADDCDQAAVISSENPRL